MTTPTPHNPSKLDEILKNAKAIKLDSEKWDDLFYLTTLKSDKAQIKALFKEIVKAQPTYENSTIIDAESLLNVIEEEL